MMVYVIRGAKFRLLIAAIKMSEKRKEYKRSWRRARYQENLAQQSNAMQEVEENAAELHVHNAHSDLSYNSDTNEDVESNVSVSEDSRNSDEAGNENLQVDDFPDEIINIGDRNVLISESNSESDVESSVSDDLVKWVNKHQIKHQAIDGLLGLMNNHFHANLPKSARTLLKTVRNVDVVEKSGMQYVNMGLKNQLCENLKRYPVQIVQDVQQFSISINIDGLPLFKSTNKCLWPVLCSINLDPTVVFPVVITYGSSKPSNLEFLVDFVTELNDTMTNGILFGERNIQVKLLCIVCDAPAKAMVKGTKAYSGYYGCDNCNQKGLWVGRVTYPETDVIERTNESFRNRTQPGHHMQWSPFLGVPIDMIRMFPIDYMHQVCLGVTKKLILLWIRGSRNVKVSSQQVNEISVRLTNLRLCIPEIFARRPRGLNEIDRWKATEFRQFLLYTGKIVLKNILRPEIYNHFMSLSVAISIMVNPHLTEYRQYAHELLLYFIKEGKNIYGEEFLVYNVHSLLHLKSCIQHYASLDQCSAFVFENFMQVLKRYVRSGKQPLVQVVKRLLELQNVEMDEEKKRKLKFKYPNNIYFVGQSNNMCEILSKSNEKDEQNNNKNVCRVYTRLQSMFDVPCDSRIIGIYRGTRRCSLIKVLADRELSRQAIMVNEDGNGRAILFLAILHDF